MQKVRNEVTEDYRELTPVQARVHRPHWNGGARGEGICRGWIRCIRAGFPRAWQERGAQGVSLSSIIHIPVVQSAFAHMRVNLVEFHHTVTSFRITPYLLQVMIPVSDSVPCNVSSAARVGTKRISPKFRVTSNPVGLDCWRH
jgi:hypothetical protein